MNKTAAPPRLSVLITAYNQGPWMAQALESVLGQHTTFDIEIVVGDDASQDDTREIAERIAAAHPSQIRVLSDEPRMGMHANLLRCLRDARGEYLAILNGDDYWLSPTKAQRQVESLDRHRDWSMCFHPVRMIDEAGAVLVAKAGPGARPTYGTRDLLRSDIVPTCSAMFRRALVGELPAWFDTLPMGDWTLWLQLSTRGPMGYLDETMTVYRVRAGGAWSGLPERSRILGDIRFLTLANEHLGRQYDGTVKRSLSDLYRRLAQEQIRAGERHEAAAAFRRAIGYNALNLSAWRGRLQSYWNPSRRRP